MLRRTCMRLEIALVSLFATGETSAATAVLASGSVDVQPSVVFAGLGAKPCRSS